MVKLFMAAGNTIAQGGKRAMGYIIAWALGVPVIVLVVWFLIKNVL
jgi:hypothetical protein